MAHLSTLLGERKLGITEEGRMYASKALHPADTSVGGVKIPDGGTSPTAALQYVLTTTVECPTDMPGDTWDLALQFFAHPLCFGTMQVCAGSVDSPVGEPQPLLNPSVPGLNINEKAAAWRSLTTTCRCTYASITAELNAPTTASQGVLLACQKVIEPTVAGFCYPCQSSGNVMVVAPRVAWYPQEIQSKAYVNPDNIMANYKAYKGPAVEGAYVVLQLDDETRRWTSTQDWQTWLSVGVAVSPLYPDLVKVPGSQVLNFWQFPGLRQLTSTPTSASTFASEGTAIPPLLNRSRADLYFSGLSKMASLTFKCLVGLEVTVPVGSTFAPMCTPPFDEDLVALDAVQYVGSRMQHAYPAKYNDWNKLFGVVKSLLGASRTVLGTLHPALGVAAQAGEALAGIAEKHTRKRAKPAKQSAPVSASVAKPLPVPPRRKGEKKAALAAPAAERK